MNNNDIEILDENTLEAIDELKKEGFTRDEIKEGLFENENNAFQSKIEEEIKRAAEEIIAKNTVPPSMNTENLINKVTGISNNPDLPTAENSAFHTMTDSDFARNNPLDNDTREAIEDLERQGYTEDEISEALTDVEKSSFKGERQNQKNENIIKTSVVDKKEENIKDRIENLTGVQRATYDKVTPKNSAFANMSDFDFNDFLQTNEEKLRTEKEKDQAEELIEKRKQEDKQRRDELNALTKEELIDKIMRGEFDRIVTPQENFKITYEQDDPVEYMENRMKHDWENKSAFATMSDKEFERKFGKVDSEIKEVKPNYKFDNFEDLSKTIYNTIDKEAEIDNKFKFDRTKLKIKNENLLKKIFIGGYDLAKNAFTQVYEKVLEKTWTKKEDILKEEDKFLMPNEDTQNMKFGNFVNIEDLKDSLQNFYQNNKFKTYKVKNENGRVVKYKLSKKQLTDFIDKLGDCYTIVKNSEEKKEQYVSVEDVIKNMPSIFRKKNIWIEKLVNQVKEKIEKKTQEKEENKPIEKDISTSTDNVSNNLSENENKSITANEQVEKMKDTVNNLIDTFNNPDKKQDNISVVADGTMTDTVIIENGKTYIITENGEKKEYIPKQQAETKKPEIKENDLLVDFANKEIRPLEKEKERLPLMNWDQVMENYKTQEQKEPAMDLDSLMEQANHFLNEMNNTENTNLDQSVGGKKR